MGGRKIAEPNRSSADRPPRQKEHFSRVVTEVSSPSATGSQPVGMSEDRLIRCFKEGMKSFLNENSTQLNQPTGGQKKKFDDVDSNRQRGGGRKNNNNTSFTPSYGDRSTATGNHGDKSASGRPAHYQGRFPGKSRRNKKRFAPLCFYPQLI